MTDAKPPSQPKRSGPTRARRVLASLIAGAGVDEISAAEQLTRKRTESMLRQELRNRWMAPAEEFARLQIARLEQMILRLLDGIQDGELKAIDRALKIVDRLDRYHGFTKAKAPPRTIWRRGARPTSEEAQRDRRPAPAGATRGMTAEAAQPPGRASPGASALVSARARGSSALPTFSTSISTPACDCSRK